MYKTLAPGTIQMLPIPPLRREAAKSDLEGSRTLYSDSVPSSFYFEQK